MALFEKRDLPFHCLAHALNSLHFIYITLKKPAVK